MMTVDTLTLAEEHLEQIRALVLPQTGHEGSALLLLAPVDIACDPWDSSQRRRLISKAVVEVAIEDQVSAGGSHVTTATRTFAKALRRAAEEGLVVAFVHSHPSGPLWFSDQDDEGEAELARMARNRNGEGTEVGSLLVTGAGGLLARLWRHPHGHSPISRVVVVGSRLAVHAAEGEGQVAPDAFHRQGLAFGDDLYRSISNLRIGIVGAGATGSATAMLIGRLGGRQIVAFDPDTADTSNTSRLHSASLADAEAHLRKVDGLKRMVEGFGLGASVATVPHWVGAKEARDAIKSCDLVFGCTDDHEGRLLLNRLAYVYSVIVVDMGIRIDPRGPGQPVFGAAARVTTLVPGARCLLCRGVIDPVRAREEQIERTDPEEYLRQRDQGYIVGHAVPNPAVVHLTTDAACMAVDEVVHRLTGYRAAGSVAHRVRYFHAIEDRQPGASRPGVCRVCQDNEDWAEGDTLTPFLGRLG